jgi:hypothetical protein
MVPDPEEDDGTNLNVREDESDKDEDGDWFKGYKDVIKVVLYSEFTLESIEESSR